jgi:hypothetical protein
MSAIPAPRDWGTFIVEPFGEYRARWPKKYNDIPDAVIETWVYRHWRDFQAWHPLRPLEWRYELKEFTSEEVMEVGHVGDWMKTLTYWGDDLLDGPTRKMTWLGKFMLENGTTPSPLIIAREAAGWRHPREHGCYMQAPLQIIEGHMRLAYLRALIRRSHSSVKPVHQVVLATLPPAVPSDA